jgi:hypothetical protein
MDLATLEIYLSAILIFGVMSVLYKENPIYAIIENAMIGVNLAHLLIVGFTSINQNLIGGLTGGDWTMIIPILIGLSYLTIFSRGMAPIYRSIISTRIGSMIGIEVGMSVTVAITQITAIAEGVGTEIGNLLAIATIIICLFYFTFSRMTERVFAAPRKVARWAMFLYFAAYIATLYGTRVDAFVGWMFTFALSPAVYIIPIIAIVLAVDVFVGWKKIFGMKEVAVEA